MQGCFSEQKQPANRTALRRFLNRATQAVGLAEPSRRRRRQSRRNRSSYENSVSTTRKQAGPDKNSPKSVFLLWRATPFLLSQEKEEMGLHSSPRAEEGTNRNQFFPFSCERKEPFSDFQRKESRQQTFPVIRGGSAPWRRCFSSDDLLVRLLPARCSLGCLCKVASLNRNILQTEPTCGVVQTERRTIPDMRECEGRGATDRGEISQVTKTAFPQRENRPGLIKTRPKASFFFGAQHRFFFPQEERRNGVAVVPPRRGGDEPKPVLSFLLRKERTVFRLPKKGKPPADFSCDSQRFSALAALFLS